MPLPAPVITATFPASRAVTARPYPARGPPPRARARPSEEGRRLRRRCDTGPMSTHAVPLVGVTTYHQQAAWGPWDRLAAVLPASYVDTVAAAGGGPVLLTPSAGGAGGGRRAPGAG